MWDILIELIEAKKLKVTTVKVKSHAEKQVLRSEVNLEHYLGNLLADAGADAAAERAVDTNGARDTSHVEAVTFLVAKRLAIIEAGLWNDKQHMVPEPPSRERKGTNCTDRDNSQYARAAADDAARRLHVYGSTHPATAGRPTTTTTTTLTTLTTMTSVRGHSSQTR